MNNSTPPDAIASLFASGVGLLVVGIGILIAFGILIAICYMLNKSLSAIPAEHRKMEPGMVWLLLIPCFNLVWNFFVFLRIPDSFASYFNSVGRTDVGDCGRNLGKWYAITAVLAMVPLVNMIAGPASLVLLILCLVRFNELKNKIAR